MVILFFFGFKIVKIDQLQIGVESREPTNDSGFFHLKHSDTIAEQKKLHFEDFCRVPSSKKKIPSDHGNMVTRYNAAGRFQSITFFLSQNRK